ncbi:TSUP family transporter [Flavisolibacter ginsenosidimutans]|uniref:Probable membrane transporter protein n=1 Tax=Flavisolibacter ginsenosidimutans TaxID=661481 RepID=A0A5B8UHJ6_9BACT|nr:TSUP family transporter [Flavisolibacter ginsenosidimutans]QEC55892.1 TSUP family transporter [Flavisolibacter ginsenosidimutans]
MLVQETNKLFPVFLKLEQLSILIVGGGNVGLEKLSAVLNNSPLTKIKLVATSINETIRDLAIDYPNIQLEERPFEESDVDGADIVIIGINDKSKSAEIALAAKSKNKLVNVADTPDLCDFYLSSVVQKGNVKIAISTNGKSPTVAKRLKEVLNDAIPAEINGVATNLSLIRENLNGNFEEKVKQLNELTKTLVSKQMTLEEVNKPGQKLWQKIVFLCLFAFVFMIIGHTVLSYVPFEKLIGSIKTIPQFIDTKMFLMMLLCGFLAQMTDGSLGMGYGTISTTFLLAIGVNPAIVSSRVHAARVFSSGVSGYSHHRFGNINKKLFKTLVIPGIVGAALGATVAYFGQKYSTYVRIPLSLYTVYLGFYILRKAFSKPTYETKVKRAGWLAATGGFMDAFAGGGWGTLVTSTLMSKRRSPRYVIGSVCLAEFFVVFVSSMVFFILLESLPLFDIAGLIIGGLIAAPIAARLVGKLPIKTMFILVGLLVMLTSCNTLWKAIGKLL